MDYPHWFENYEPGDENVELVEMLLDMRENGNCEKELTRKVSLPTYR